MIVIGVLAMIIVGGAFKYFYDKSHKNTDINDNKQKKQRMNL